MKHLIIYIAVAATLTMAAGCSGRPVVAGSPYVRAENGHFILGDSVYRYSGTNFWYGAILASQGRGGDRDRLTAELDLMQCCGIDNLRVLVGGDGREGLTAHIEPVLQTAPGVYNDTLLDGLDYLMAELERRGMHAVLYLNNAWEWSGGYGTYLEWAGMGDAPVPGVDGYRTYTDYVGRFVHNDSAKAMALRHADYIVRRTNRYTERPYSQSPALMAWQICNEPRSFARDSLSKELFAQWIQAMARTVKDADSNHLVSTGNEGYNGCEGDTALWVRIHSMPEIDYATIHIWPCNWQWVDRTALGDSLATACRLTSDYIRTHYDAIKATGKPLVLEEFGYPRDGYTFSTGTATTSRDRYYEYIYDEIGKSDMIQGINFWGWGGLAQPPHQTWQPGDPYTGDPAQEPQGLYSVFATDTATLGVIGRFKL